MRAKSKYRLFKKSITSDEVPCLGGVHGQVRAKGLIFSTSRGAESAGSRIRLSWVEIEFRLSP
jgi:hypothetical protein